MAALSGPTPVAGSWLVPDMNAICIPTWKRRCRCKSRRSIMTTAWQSAYRGIEQEEQDTLRSGGRVFGSRSSRHGWGRLDRSLVQLHTMHSPRDQLTKGGWTKYLEGDAYVVALTATAGSRRAGDAADSGSVR